MAGRRSGGVLAFTREQSAAIAYTRRWFAVYEWVTETLDNISGFEWGGMADPAERLTRIRAVVKQRDNEEVAFRNAVPIISLIGWLQRPAPGREDGGKRRVAIRLFTWQMDRKNKIAHDPAWIVVADEQSAYASQARARRWASDYANKLEMQEASRELGMTAIEIAFWTSSPRSRLL